MEKPSVSNATAVLETLCHDGRSKTAPVSAAAPSGPAGADLDECEVKELQLRPVSPVAVVVRKLSATLTVGRSRHPRIPGIFTRKQAASGGAEGDSKVILSNVSAHAPSGSITAVLGASGSGKTSFLNVLSRRHANTPLHETGDILYNGNPDIATVRSAYVVQQDVLIPTLTVRETLQYAAQLRLPEHTNAKERRRIIQEVILELGLKECADTRIGSSEQRGCSGGEKRRTSLGVQLLANPSVLFLDEVTTGLDATTAFQLVRTLKQLAKRGRTVIVTIHQPRSEIWEFFDHIILLAEGSPVYSGPAEACLQHFNALGYALPPFVNPAEYLIDLVAIDSRTQQLAQASRTRIERLKQASCQRETDDAMVSCRSIPAGQQTAPCLQQASFSCRLKVQTLRTLKTTWRDPNGLAGSMLEALSMGIITGWIFYDLDGSLSGIRSREGALYICVALQGYLVLLYETYRLTLEIGVFDSEREEGVVDTWSFLLSRRAAKFLTEDIPGPFMFSVIVYFMAGFRRDATQFFIFFALLLLNHYTSVTFAMLSVSVSRDYATASLLGNLSFTLQSLCSGFLIQTMQIPVYVRWLKWTAFAFYAIGALMTNEFIGTSDSASGHLYDCPFNGGATNSACAPWTGRYVIELLGFPPNGWIWRPAIILVAFSVVLYTIAGLLFTFLNTVKRLSRLRSNEDSPEAVDEICSRPKIRLEPLNIALQSVAMTIEKRHILRLTKEERQILQPLNVEFSSGVLNAIIGVSGGGKTSLLNIMAGRLASTYFTKYKVSGSVLAGKSPLSQETIRSIASYVCQSDDTLLPDLTVRETLLYAARLRLPSSMSASDRTNRVEGVIQRLGLRTCADTLVGSDQVKGISGGEKRRLSIAVQILAEPQILFLDEPTSGLDAFTASTILDTLRGLAEDGRTVILTIHQASLEHFRQFGSVLVLARGGHSVYSGPSKGMLPYFASIGYPCPENMNPADFALDISSVDLQSSHREQVTREKVQGLINSWAASDSQTDRGTHNNFGDVPHPQAFHRAKTASTLLTTTILLQRSALSFRRSSAAISARTTQVLGLAVLLTLFYTPLHNDQAGVQTHVGLLQQMLAVYFVGMLQNVAIYPAEQAVFRNENDDGVYNVEPFFLSYTIFTLPFDIVNGILLGILVTFAVGFPRTGTVFGVISFVSFGLVSCGESIGIIFNTLFRSSGFAVSLVSVILSLGLIMSGIVTTKLNVFLAAVNHVSPAKWAVAAMAPYTLHGVHFSCDLSECPVRTGQDVLQLYHLDGDGRLPLLWLAIIIVGYRALAYVLLKITRREWGLSFNRSPRKVSQSAC